MPLSSGDQAAAAPAPLLAGEGGSPGEGLLLFRGSRSGVPGPFSFLVLPTYAGILQLSLYQLDLLPVSRRLSVGTPLCVEVLLTCLPGGGAVPSAVPTSPLRVCQERRLSWRRALRSRGVSGGGRGLGPAPRFPRSWFATSGKPAGLPGSSCEEGGSGNLVCYWSVLFHPAGPVLCGQLWVMLIASSFPTEAEPEAKAGLAAF